MGQGKGKLGGILLGASALLFTSFLDSMSVSLYYGFLLRWKGAQSGYLFFYSLPVFFLYSIFQQAGCQGGLVLFPPLDGNLPR